MSFLNNFRRAHAPVISQEQMVTWQLSGTGTALGASAQFYPSVSDIVFTTSSSGGETIAVVATLANLKTVTPKVYSVSTGLPATATALASGTYYIKDRETAFNTRLLTFTKSAAVQNGIVSGVAIKQSYNSK